VCVCGCVCVCDETRRADVAAAAQRLPDDNDNKRVHPRKPKGRYVARAASQQCLQFNNHRSPRKHWIFAICCRNVSVRSSVRLSVCQLHLSNPRLLFNFCWATMTNDKNIKKVLLPSSTGRFALELSSVKAVFGRKFVPSKWGQKWRFRGNGGVNLSLSKWHLLQYQIMLKFKFQSVFTVQYY